MSCYLIKVENGHKVARSITSEEEYKQLRGSNEQKANLRLARAGNDAAKRRLVQFNYSGHYPQGVVKGMKLPSGAFGFDMDEPEAFAKAAKLLLKEPDKYGLLMLERSARQGGHAVFVREKGKTVLENQVRIATMLKCEMDTSAHDINRVYFTTTSDEEDLLFLSPRLFKDEYDEAAVAAEGKVLEERERYGQEELPEGAHKANKHYEPWKEEFKKDSQGGVRVRNLRIREFLLLLRQPQLRQLLLQQLLLLQLLKTITSGFLMEKSLRSGGRCIMMGRSRCVLIAIR